MLTYLICPSILIIIFYYYRFLIETKNLFQILGITGSVYRGGLTGKFEPNGFLKNRFFKSRAFIEGARSFLDDRTLTA